MFSVRLPNKSIPYGKSVFMYLPRILQILAKRKYSPLQLYQKIEMAEKDWGDYMDALDCLFALSAIELSKDGRLLRYVGRNPQ